MKLILIKHGETKESRKNIILGQLPGYLSAKGKSESNKIAEIIKKSELSPEFILSSDLNRAKETAKIIGKKLNLPIKYQKLLRERHAGIAQDKKDSEIDWITYEKKSLEKRKHTGGESFSDVKKRAKKFLQLIKKMNDDKNIIIVSHSAFILMLLSEFYKISIKKALKIPIQPYVLDTKKRGRNILPSLINVLT